MPKTPAQLIPAFNFASRKVTAYPAYWNAEAKTFTPLSKVKGHHEVHEVLDSLTLALEAGVVPKDGWLKFIFGTPTAFENFLEHLESYDEAFRITDRWWMALARLTGTVDEEGFIFCQDIADTLRERARKSNQL